MRSSESLRLSKTILRGWSALKVAFGVAVLIAIPLICAVMLFWAMTEGTVLSLNSYDRSWITYQGAPGWFVTSVSAYALFSAASIVFLILVMVGWRHDRTLFRRRETAPPIDGAIRQAPEER